MKGDGLVGNLENKNNMSEELKPHALVEFLMFIIGCFLVAPFEGYVFQTGWNFFVFPLTGSYMPYWTGLGLFLLISYAAKGRGDGKKSVTEVTLIALVVSVFSLLFFHVINYLRG
jgi:hypothetical protein